MLKMYSLLHMYNVHLCPAHFSPLYKNKFVTGKILKTGVDLPANQQDKRFSSPKLKRKKSTNYIHYWLVFRCFLVYFIFVADPLWWNVVGRWWLSCRICCMDWNKWWAVVAPTPANSIQLCAKIPRKNSIRYATEVGCLRCLGMARNVFIMSRYSQNKKECGNQNASEKEMKEKPFKA